jgi:hypothetical protein
VLELPVAARAQRIEQDSVQRVELEAVVVAALGGVFAASIALCVTETLNLK